MIRTIPVITVMLLYPGVQLSMEKLVCSFMPVLKQH